VKRLACAAIKFASKSPPSSQPPGEDRQLAPAVRHPNYERADVPLITSQMPSRV
jgi:hypothetical protein